LGRDLGDDDDGDIEEDIEYGDEDFENEDESGSGFNRTVRGASDAADADSLEWTRRQGCPCPTIRSTIPFTSATTSTSLRR
jgi:hypothetical protein